MAYSVIVLSQVMATNVDSLNNTVTSGSQLENGNVFRLTGLSGSSGYTEVFYAGAPTTGSLNNLWMAAAPEVVIVTAADGTEYKGINVDPRNFVSAADSLVDAFRPMPGDIILMSEDAFSGAKSTNTIASARQGYFDLIWSGAAVDNCLNFQYLGTENIVIGSGSAIGDAYLTAYRMLCLTN